MPKTTEPVIPVKEYADRRTALMRALGDGVGLVFAGAQADPLHDDFRPHPHFEYLTGIVDEPNAVLMLDPKNPQATRRTVLYLRPLNPELEQWDGLRERIGSSLREQYGVPSIFRLGQFGRFLNEAARRTRRLVCLHPFANHDQPVSPDLAVFRSVLERIPGVTIDDATDAIASLRAVKSTHEVALMQHAIDISIASYLELMPRIAPGQSEFDIQEMLEHGYRTRGSRGPAYGSIVGSAINSTVLHYRANSRTVDDGDLICIDSGAAYRGYGADITRTFPANGTFTARQRDVYDVVLAALNAAIKAVKPGVTLGELDTVARKIITKAGYGDFFIHSIGHHLGLETHDVTPAGALKAGNVITIEPGIYIP
ncbi:MAG: aminopeptidase P family protein, partial [Phycisphaerales bacterium]|nr:aminopeptidase P family protein [Phycisphaerales bacterium]